MKNTNNIYVKRNAISKCVRRMNEILAQDDPKLLRSEQGASDLDVLVTADVSSRALFQLRQEIVTSFPGVGSRERLYDTLRRDSEKAGVKVMKEHLLPRGITKEILDSECKVSMRLAFPDPDLTSAIAARIHAIVEEKIRELLQANELTLDDSTSKMKNTEDTLHVSSALRHAAYEDACFLRAQLYAAFPGGIESIRRSVPDFDTILREAAQFEGVNPQDAERCFIENTRFHIAELWLPYLRSCIFSEIIHVLDFDESTM